MNDGPDNMVPDEVDVAQWFPKPAANPFPDPTYGPQNRLGRSNWIADEANSMAPETSPPLQDNFHPFKIVIADSKAYVFPGYVYGNDGTRMFQKIIPTISGNALGNPLYGETPRYLALSEQYLWVKVTVAATAITAAEIVYSATGSATDSLSLIHI